MLKQYFNLIAVYCVGRTFLWGEWKMRLLDVFTMIESVAPYPGAYNPWLPILSIFIAVLSSFVALAVSSRMNAAATWQARWAWVSAGACSMGGGIWGMHFIGMLAFSLPCGIDYNPLGTLASMIPGIVASGRSEE